MSADRFDEAWVAYTCSDCDPTLFPDEPSDYEKPYVMVVPEGESVPEFCPRCASYLSLLDGEKDLRIANTPAERWAQRKKEEADAGS